MNKAGIVFDIQRFSIHDGPGIRTTVFLKGCPLRCIWCHNPESQAFQPETSYVDSSRKAVKIIGKRMTTEEVMNVVKRDIPYYQNSGGGITVSGGEPMAQFEFTLELLKAAKELGINTAMETCGYAPQTHYKEILPYTDLFLYDYKETDAKRHEEFTGVSNERILSNLDFLCSQNAAVILRCPIIPGYNDTENHFKGITNVSQKYSNILSVEIMPYHDFGRSKAENMGKEYLIHIKTVSNEQKSEWVKKLKEMGCRNIEE